MGFKQQWLLLSKNNNNILIKFERRRLNIK